MMKILWFANSPAGGDEILMGGGLRSGWLSSLSDALKDKIELSVAFYYARYSLPFEHKGVKYFPFCKRHWKYHIIKKMLFGEFVDRHDLTRYLDIIDQVKPDLIHIHGTENPFGCLIGEVDLPVVVSIQGNCTVTNYKYFSGIDRRYAHIRGVNFASPLSILLNKSFNNRYNKSSVKITERERRNLTGCKNIIGRTDWDRRITRILSPGRIYYHNDEILRNIFYQQVWKWPGNSKVIVHSTIGESIIKGFETICRTIYELNNIGFMCEWRVAGVEKSSLLNKVVTRQLGSFYPQRGLHLLGNIDHTDLVDRLLEADIYVMPSHIENSPNSLCEAMIIGMPCITTMAGGSSSLLKDKEEGLVIQDGDPWSMAGAIMELSADPDRAITYGHNARIRALERHDRNRITDDLLEIYIKIRENEDR